MSSDSSDGNKALSTEACRRGICSESVNHHSQNKEFSKSQMRAYHAWVTDPLGLDRRKMPKTSWKPVPRRSRPRARHVRP